jgi:hypothetical protein
MNGAEDKEEQQRIAAVRFSFSSLQPFPPSAHFLFPQIAEAARMEEEEAERVEAKKRKHGDRQIEAQGGVKFAGSTETLTATLKELAAFKLEDEDVSVKSEAKRPEVDTKGLKEKMKDLELRACVVFSLLLSPPR